MSAFLAEKQLSFRLEAHISELNWLAWSAWQSIKKVAATIRPTMNEVGLGSTQQVLAAERVFLRKQLCRSPTWLSGHLRLGMAELQISRLATKETSPRAVAAARLSALAAERLMNASPHADGGKEKFPRQFFELKLLRALLEQCGHRHSAALGIFEEIFSPSGAVQLPLTLYYIALENAATSALALQQKKVARDYLESIPVPARNGEVLMALSFLENDAASAASAGMNGSPCEG